MLTRLTVGCVASSAARIPGREGGSGPVAQGYVFKILPHSAIGGCDFTSAYLAHCPIFISGPFVGC